MQKPNSWSAPRSTQNGVIYWQSKILHQHGEAFRSTYLYLFRVVRLHVLSSNAWIRDKTDMTFFNASSTPMTREPSLNTLESWTSEADNNSYYVSNIQCPLHCYCTNFHVANTLSCLKHTIFVQSCFCCVLSSTCF